MPKYVLNESPNRYGRQVKLKKGTAPKNNGWGFRNKLRIVHIKLEKSIKKTCHFFWQILTFVDNDVQSHEHQIKDMDR